MATKTAVTGITVTSATATDTMSVAVGKTINVTAIVTPWNADDKDFTVEVEAGKDSILTASGAVLTGVGEGSALVTVKSAKYPSVSKVITVTVEEGYTVKFVTNGGSAIADILVNKNSKLPEGITTTLAGHKFVGWYKDEALTQAFDVATDIIDADNTILYAKFVAQSIYDAKNDTSAGWAAYDKNGTALAATSKNYWLYQTPGGNNKEGTAPAQGVTDAVATYKLSTSNAEYLQGTVYGYVKAVNVDVYAGTTSTSNAVEVTIKAYASDGTEVATATGNTTAKLTSKITATLTSTTKNIAYIRITSTTSSRNIGVTYAEMTYDRQTDERSNTFVTFGTDGNYGTANASINLTGATISDNKTDGGSKVDGTVTVDVNAGGVVYAASYQYYANFDFVIGSNAPVHFEKQSGYIQVTEDTTVTINSTGYFTGIYVLYPTSTAGWTFGSGNVSDELKVTLQKKSLVSTTGLVSDATWSDGSSTTKIDYTNNTSYSQNNSFVLFVAPANSTVTVVTYDNKFTINGVAVTGDGNNISTDVKVGAQQLIVVEATGNSYLKSITIAK